MQQHEGQAWCAGVAEKARRPLQHEELEILRARLATATRRVRWWQRIKRAFLWLAAVGFVPFVFQDFPNVKHWIAIPLIYLLGILPAVAAVIAAFVEVIAGFSRLLRVAFFALFAVLALGVALGTDSPLFPVAAFAPLAIYLVGLFMAIIRGRAFHRLAKTAPLVAADLEAGEAIELEGMPPADEPLPEELPKPLRALFKTGRQVAFAVLPRSGVLIGIDGRAVDSHRAFEVDWQPVELTFTPPGGGFEARLPGAPSEAGLTQRHASRAELEELRVHRQRLLRRAGITFLGLTYFGALIARAAESLLAAKLSATLSGGGWIIALCFGTAVAARFLYLRMRLGRALADGRLLIVRDPNDEVGAASIAEIFAVGGVIWTQDGQPAAWRRRRF